MESKVAALEARCEDLTKRLKKAELLADPELFSKLQTALSTNSFLEQKQLELQKRCSGYQTTIEKTRSNVSVLKERVAVTEQELEEQRLQTTNLKAQFENAMRLQKRQTTVSTMMQSHEQRALKVENLRLKEQVKRQEAAQQHKQMQLEQLQILLQELFQPTNTLLISLSRIQQQQAALQQQLEKKDSMVNATEAEKAKLEAEFDVAREAHNEEVEKLKSHYEARLGDLHAALKSNASLATSIQEVKDTISNSSNNNSTYVRRQSLDNKIFALEKRLTASRSEEPATTSVKKSTRKNTKQAPRKASKSKVVAADKAKSSRVQSKHHSKNSAFAVGQEDDEGDHSAFAVGNDEDDFQFALDDDITGSEETSAKAAQKPAPKSKTKQPTRKAKRTAKSAKSTDKPVASSSGLDLVAMFDDSGPSADDFVVEEAPKPKRKARRKTVNKKSKPAPKTTKSLLKPSWKSNAAAPKLGFSKVGVPADLSKIDASPISGSSKQRISVASAATFDTSRRSSNASMFGSFLEAFKVPKVKLGGRLTTGARGSRRRRK